MKKAIGLYLLIHQFIFGLSIYTIEKNNSEKLLYEGDNYVEYNVILGSFLARESEKKIRIQGDLYLTNEKKINSNTEIIFDEGSQVFLMNEIYKTLFELNGSDIKIKGFNLNCDNKSVKRVFKINDFSKNVTLSNFIIENIRNIEDNSLVWVIDISGLGVSNFLIENGYIRNIYAKGNGKIADAIGSVRGIIVSNRDKYKIPSDGLISNLIFRDIYGDILPKWNFSEDADAIHINPHNIKMNIEIKNCYFDNIGKRALKIQSDGIKVNNLYIKSDLYMYSFISLYGNNCVLNGIILKGNTYKQLENMGMDNKIENVLLNE